MTAGSYIRGAIMYSFEVSCVFVNNQVSVNFPLRLGPESLYPALLLGNLAPGAWSSILNLFPGMINLSTEVTAIAVRTRLEFLTLQEAQAVVDAGRGDGTNSAPIIMRSEK